MMPRFAPIPAAIREAEEALAKQIAAKTAEENRIRQAVDKAKAADILNSKHPAHEVFMVWLNGKPATKRQARKFCHIAKAA